MGRHRRLVFCGAPLATTNTHETVCSALDMPAVRTQFTRENLRYSYVGWIESDNIFGSKWPNRAGCILDGFVRHLLRPMLRCLSAASTIFSSTDKPCTSKQTNNVMNESGTEQVHSTSVFPSGLPRCKHRAACRMDETRHVLLPCGGACRRCTCARCSACWWSRKSRSPPAPAVS